MVEIFKYYPDFINLLRNNTVELCTQQEMCIIEVIVNYFMAGLSPKIVKKLYDFFLLHYLFSEEKYWTYDDKGHVSFRDISLPANLHPESKVKVM